MLFDRFHVKWLEGILERNWVTPTSMILEFLTRKWCNVWLIICDLKFVGTQILCMLDGFNQCLEKHHEWLPYPWYFKWAVKVHVYVNGRGCTSSRSRRQLDPQVICFFETFTLKLAEDDHRWSMWSQEWRAGKPCQVLELCRAFFSIWSKSELWQLADAVPHDPIHGSWLRNFVKINEP